jgi:hypothetical protein
MGGAACRPALPSSAGALARSVYEHGNTVVQIDAGDDAVASIGELCAQRDGGIRGTQAARRRTTTSDHL